jgi:hypothetical protein
MPCGGTGFFSFPSLLVSDSLQGSISHISEAKNADATLYIALVRVVGSLK